MTRQIVIAALLGASSLAIAAPALAQEAPAEPVVEQTEPDTSDAAADAAIAAAQPVDEAQAKIELLTEQVAALQASLAAIQAQMTATTPSWKGAPLLEDKENGWSFKPRGRIQYDAGFVGNPEDDIVSRNLGFNSRVRRFRLGAEGTIPGGFGYKAEVDFAGASVGFGDVIITYQPKGKPWNVTIGNHETFNGLEQMSSSRFLSFLERAAFDDAFINTRRIGLSAGYANEAGTFRINGGLFAAHSIDSSLDNDGWIAATRAVYSPMSGSNQLHFGANIQHRNFQSNNGTTAASSSGQPSTNQLARYRARPFSQLTDVRFVDTQNFAAKSDTIFGLEAAGIFKSLHLVAEAQYLTTNAYDEGQTIAAGDPLDLFPAASQFVPDGDPNFWGGYVEAGYYFTGETRGYKNGLWDRTKVLKPFSKGGWGALQLNARLDYLDLDSSKLKSGCSNNFVTGVCTGVAQLQKGGKQLGFLASLVWLPEDYMRFYLQASHARITGGPFAATVVSVSGDPVDERHYSSSSVQARAQVDF
ncbi:OprO/OprP family phosphate-selective porin [Sphingomonas mesophila]|uniref:OprO/OprP family phosphate-selective porin n=1 Tax=Sphingomonas mesophila TaxID=2303576 RepID=UPI000E574203|nr:porin [Sphingomonas mesophila]